MYASSPTKMNKKSLLCSSIGIRATLFSEVSIGIGANAVLLLLHVLPVLLKHRPKPTDLPVAHLALIHLVMLLTVGFIATDIFMTQERRWDDLTCKSLFFLYRVMRGLSICTTCLLSVLQAVTLSPRSSCLAKFKHESSCHHLTCVVLLWVFNVFVSVHSLISTVATPNVTSESLMFVTKSCSLQLISNLLKYMFSSLLIFWDVFFIGLMALSCGYMVTLLHRHQRQFQHLHSSRLSTKASPEQRATQTILLLLSFFVFMYFLDCIISYSSRILRDSDPVHLCLQMFVGNGYATVSPLVLISTEKHIFNFLKSLWGGTVNVIN